MGSRELIWAFVLILTFLGAVTGWRTRQIPNWPTVPGLFAGLARRPLVSGSPGAQAALGGAGFERDPGALHGEGEDLELSADPQRSRGCGTVVRPLGGKDGFALGPPRVGKGFRARPGRPAT